MIAPEVRGDREEPRPDIGAAGQGAVRPERAKEGLLREIVGVGSARRDSQQVAPYLRVMGSHHRLEGILCHHPAP
jgi:hypothetical protein